MMENVNSKRLKRDGFTPCQWSELPINMVMSIVARLPLPQLFQACLICKEWNLFISSHKFLSIYNDNFFKYYYPIIRARTSGVTLKSNFQRSFNYRHIEDKEERLPKKVFGYNQRQGRWEKFPPLKDLLDQAYKLIDVAEGILCLRGVSNLFVYNLLMRTCTQLPPITNLLNMQKNSVTILVDCNTNSYQVTMVGWVYKRCTNDINLCRGVAIYESIARTWRTASVSYPSQVDRLGLKMRFEEAIVLKETLYCRMMEYKMGNPSTIGLMIYNLQAKVWHDRVYIIPSHNRYYQSDRQFLKVVQCSGDIYLVFIRARSCKGRLYFKNIKVFKLDTIANYAPLTNECSIIQPVENAWRFITSEDIDQDLSRVDVGVQPIYKIVCIGSRNQIYISMGIHFILVYNIDTHCWNKLL